MIEIVIDEISDILTNYKEEEKTYNNNILKKEYFRMNGKK